VFLKPEANASAAEGTAPEGSRPRGQSR